MKDKWYYYLTAILSLDTYPRYEGLVIRFCQPLELAEYVKGGNYRPAVSFFSFALLPFFLSVRKPDNKQI